MKIGETYRTRQCDGWLYHITNVYETVHPGKKGQPSVSTFRYKAYLVGNWPRLEFMGTSDSLRLYGEPVDYETHAKAIIARGCQCISMFIDKKLWDYEKKTT